MRQEFAMKMFKSSPVRFFYDGAEYVVLLFVKGSFVRVFWGTNPHELFEKPAFITSLTTIVVHARPQWTLTVNEGEREIAFHYRSFRRAEDGWPRLFERHSLLVSMEQWGVPLQQTVIFGKQSLLPIGRLDELIYQSEKAYQYLRSLCGLKLVRK